MIAYLRDEPGAAVVEESLDGEEGCVAHVINLCEVYYDFIRSEDESTASEAMEDLKSSGVIPREDIDELFWRDVGRHKGNIRRISLADCFAISLTNRLGGELMTSDHNEFDPIAAQNICRVKFIR